MRLSKCEFQGAHLGVDIDNHVVASIRHGSELSCKCRVIGRWEVYTSAFRADATLSHTFVVDHSIPFIQCAKKGVPALKLF